MNHKNINDIITESFAIEAQDAKNAGTLGYMCRSLVQATLPHKQAKTNEFVRKNGAFTLSIMAPSETGLPYGTIPRLVIAWLTTEAVKTKEREIVLGHSLSEFMRELNLVPTGGRWGTITRLRDQMERLFSSFITCSHTDPEISKARKNLMLADKYNLWWEPKQPGQLALWESTVTLSQPFFDEIVNNPVPIDLRAIKALKRSPMALDIYCWLTYRMFSVKRTTPPIPWEALQLQFGADYERTRDFKAAFLQQLKKVSVIYPGARISVEDKGLILMPSPTHIKALG